MGINKVECIKVRRALAKLDRDVEFLESLTVVSHAVAQSGVEHVRVLLREDRDAHLECERPEGGDFERLPRAAPLDLCE